MVVLAVLLYCLVPSGCPIGHIVYLWTLTVAVSRFFCVVCRQKRYHRQSLAPQWFCGFAVLCAREVPTVKPHPLYDLQAHTFS